jgi:DNA-binding transcriptional ArsR family regulator
MGTVTEHTDGPARGTARGAAARGAARGEENAAAILAEVGARRTASAAEIGRAVGVSERRVRDHLYRLAAAGLVERSGTRWRTTSQGSARAGPTVSARDVAATLDLLPSEAHRALARLALSAVVARRARERDGVTGWPSFGLWGPPGTAKTTVGRLLARLLGLSEPETVRVASDLDRAELLGRRVPDGSGGYRFAPAALLGRPLVCLDELDKVRGDARGDALRLLQGDSALVLEREHLVVAATVVVTLNAGHDPRDVLPADRLRRMVHVSTAGVPEAACRKAARRLFDEGSMPVLDLDRLDVPAGVGAEVAGFFDEVVVRSLLPGARPLYPGHALTLIVPGRMALHGADEGAAAEAVAADFLTCAATWGGALPDAAARFGAKDTLPAAVDDDEPERSERAERVRLAQARALGAKRLGGWRRLLSQAHDDEAVAIRAGLDECGAQLRAARSVAETLAVAELARPLMDQIERRAGEREVAAGPSARPRSGGARVGAGRHSVLVALERNGSHEAPGRVLERLGLVEDWPWPPGELTGHRWRGSTPETRGAVIFDGDGWGDLAVRAVISAAIRADADAGPAPLLALVAGRSA